MKKKARENLDELECLRSLADEEFEKLKPLSEEIIQAAIEEGQKARQAFLNENMYGQYINTRGRIFFR